MLMKRLARLPIWPGCLWDPFAEADEDTGETKQSQNYIHIRIQRQRHSIPVLSNKRTKTDEPAERNGRKTLTTVQGLPKKFDQKKILKVIKKKFGRRPGHLHLAIGVSLSRMETNAV
ncbi:MAG: hypothetical protein Q9226_005264 [Calogaya cf. arnoldii]